MTRSGPLGAGRTGSSQPFGATDRAFEAPVVVRNGRITLAFAGPLTLNADGEVEIELEGLAQLLAPLLVSRGLVAEDGKILVREAPPVPALTQTISGAYVQAEIVAIQNKVNELLSRLKAVDHLQE